MTLYDVAFYMYIRAANLLWRLFLAYWTLYIQLKAIGDI